MRSNGPIPRHTDACWLRGRETTAWGSKQTTGRGPDGSCENARPDRRTRDRGGVTHHPGLLRTAPLQGETTSSLICRIASRYGMEAKALRSYWQWRNYPPGHNGGGARADAEVLLNTAGRQLLAGLSGAEEDVLARALPSWGQEDTKLSAGKNGVPAAAWRTGGAVAGPVAFGCRLCAARRTGDGRAGGAVRAALGAGVCPAWAVASGRGRRPAS